MRRVPHGACKPRSDRRSSSNQVSLGGDRVARPLQARDRGAGDRWSSCCCLRRSLPFVRHHSNAREMINSSAQQHPLSDSGRAGSCLCTLRHGHWHAIRPTCRSVEPHHPHCRAPLAQRTSSSSPITTDEQRRGRSRPERCRGSALHTGHRGSAKHLRRHRLYAGSGGLGRAAAKSDCCAPVDLTPASRGDGYGVAQGSATPPRSPANSSMR